MKTKLKIYIALFFLSVSGLSAQYFGPKVSIDSLVNFSRQDSLRLNEEIELLENLVLQNPNFWNDLRQCDFKCSNQLVIRKRSVNKKGTYPKKNKKQRFVKDYTNDEIFDMLFLGNDLIGNANDSILNLNLKLYERDTKSDTKGRTNGFYQIIKSYRNKTINQEKGTYAAHLLHEYLHLLGFVHISQSAKRNKRKCRGYDVPYSIGKLAQKYLNLEVIGEEDLCVD
ncbi:hypothetical protein ABV409_12800 [Flagellimonas sp. DF-77]|uniref:hypothetical protein n=1 Tax=Flagellimonas algarum TaxID=3230298 RepID=UPI0033911F35